MIGAKGEFVLSPRLDDLQSAFALTKAFTESTPAEYINLCAVFDNEEVGSGTRQGADSTFLEDTLQRITEGLQEGHSTYLRWVADSFLISADNAHAVHPNHPEKADPANRPYLNGGIVIPTLREVPLSAIFPPHMYQCPAWISDCLSWPCIPLWRQQV